MLRLAEHGTVEFGSKVFVRADCFFNVEGALRLGDNVFINRGAYISVKGSVVIGARTRLGERVSIHDANHIFEPVDSERPELYDVKTVEIGVGVWIGANVVLVAGSKIGEGSVIGAGSVVTGIIPPNVLAAGSPAVVVRKLSV